MALQDGTRAQPLWRRLVAVGAILGAAALGLGVLRTARGEVDVVYRFGDDRQISGVRVDYLALGGGEPDDLSLAWEFGGKGPPTEKVHRARLRPGPHRIGLRVRAVDGSWRTGETQIEIPETGGVRLVVEVADVVGPSGAAGPAPVEAPAAPAEAPAPTPAPAPGP